MSKAEKMAERPCLMCRKRNIPPHRSAVCEVCCPPKLEREMKEAREIARVAKEAQKVVDEVEALR